MALLPLKTSKVPKNQQVLELRPVLHPLSNMLPDQQTGTKFVPALSFSFVRKRVRSYLEGHRPLLAMT